jgi:tetratricopeptide (TPR) repeat protein
MKYPVALAGIFFVFVVSAVHAESISPIDRLIAEMKPRIGTYPPVISTVSEQESVESKYGEARKLLDEAIARNKNNTDLLYKRGYLFFMGNNLGDTDAFKNAENDLKAVLKAKPDHEEAMVTLGTLYVNSRPGLVAKGETLLANAQTIHGALPLEDAQQGLFYAYYYQGKMAMALETAALLKKNWPKSEKYTSMERMALAGMARSGENGDRPRKTP